MCICMCARFCLHAHSFNLRCICTCDHLHIRVLVHTCMHIGRIWDRCSIDGRSGRTGRALCHPFMQPAGMRVYVCVFLYVCVCVASIVQMCMCMAAFLPSLIRTYTRSFLRHCMRMLYPHTHTYMYTYTHTHTDIQTYKHNICYVYVQHSGPWN